MTAPLGPIPEFTLQLLNAALHRGYMVHGVHPMVVPADNSKFREAPGPWGFYAERDGLTFSVVVSLSEVDENHG